MTDTDKKSVFLAEDHQLTRVGVGFAIEGSPDFKLVGEAEDGADAVQNVLRLQPDIVLMDIKLTGMDGIEATRQIKAESRDTKILMLTSHDGGDSVFAAFAAGADGYCVKSAASEVILQAMRAVVEGSAWIDPSIAKLIVQALPAQKPNDLVEDRKPSQKPPVVPHDLTEREIEVLRLLCTGLGNPEIALQLKITPETVKTHMRHIMEKLAVSDRTSAAIRALRMGIV